MSANPPPQQKSAAARAAALAQARLDAAISDVFLPEEARLDERTRLSVQRRLERLVNAIGADLAREAARLLADRGSLDKAETVLGSGADSTARLIQSGVLRDRDLMDEVIARVRADIVAAALPVSVDRPDQPSLLVRLASVQDKVVASAATTLLAGENRRLDADEAGVALGGELPAELQHRLIWWIAAAMRETLPADWDTDRAIGEAAQRLLAVHDEGERVEAVAMRLAAAIDPQPGEVPSLLGEAIGDRRLSLFIAVFARALDLQFETARAVVIEPEGERLWSALRAVGFDRAGIAGIGLALAEADPRRDLDAFADRLDEIAAIDSDAARAELAELSLPLSFQAAIGALARSAAA